MKAVVYDRYGPPEVLRQSEVAKPTIGESYILVRVRASAVTTADWRIRAAAFPGVLWLPGRLMFGLFRPRNRVLGTDFAGEVVETGPSVTRFRPGDRVFGFAGKGAHAEFVAVPETGAVVATPEALSDEEAAALPFGGLSALVFLRDFAGLKAGQRVAIVGASGNVGSYAVQIAKALGAEVTGVASGRNAELVRSLGADRFVDYTRDDVTAEDSRYDVIFDTVGATDFVRARRALTPNGLFLPLNFGLREMLQALRSKIFGGPRVVTAVSGDTWEDLESLVAMVSEGALRPVVDSHYPLERITDAYRRVEGRHRRGAVVLSNAESPDLEAVA